ncbi:MAG: tRNA dihydrouridine synthase DusB [Oscillospiraceae bacterium]
MEKEKLDFNKLALQNKVALAPMAGLTDVTLRSIAEEYGAAFTVSEMVSAKAICFNDRKTKFLCKNKCKEIPFGIQLFGSEIQTMAEAARIITAFNPDFIDINMGCPAPKITKSASGSALMKTPELAAEIVRAVARVVQVPVTVKMRTGWDAQSVNCAELAKMCEQAGAAAIAVHGRTQQAMYVPPVDLVAIKAVVDAVEIPVIGNGDICSADDAKNMIDETGCKMVMVGRGAMGNPWLFGEINAVLFGKELPNAPSLNDKMKLMVRHVYEMCEDKGEDAAMREARTHAAFYLKGLHGAAHMRHLTTELTYFTDIEELAKLALSSNS